MKNFLILVMICLVMPMKALPIKSALGSRGIGTSARSWTNPYITDGLVAMWDGEWNVGGGMHDAAATVWKDIISGYDLNVTSGTWGNKGLVGTSSTACNATMATVPQSFIDIATNDGCSVEAVATPLGYGTNIYGLPSPIWCVYGWGNTSIWYYFRVQSGPMDISSRGVIGEPISFSGTTDANRRARWYCNSNLINGPAAYSKPTPNNDVYLRIKGILHTVRIYNRALSEEEISYNYSVDKERFGLP